VRRLFELAITIETSEDIDDPRHCVIGIEPAVNSSNTDEFLDPRLSDEEIGQELRLVGLVHAGTLSGLAIWLTPWIDFARQQHGCGGGGALYPEAADHIPPTGYEACAISSRGCLTPPTRSATSRAST
jgi:hypothetical protein